MGSAVSDVQPARRTPDLRTVRGAELVPLLPALAALRIEVFRDWPYLYEGDETYERGYLRAYADDPDAAVVVAALDGEPVGAATCQPMANTHGEVRAAFESGGVDPATTCYFGESVLRRAHRGGGVGVGFFAHREAHARALGLRRAVFCGVVRDPSDPRRPPDHTPLDAFWRKRGYRPLPGVVVRLDWREVGGSDEVPHDLTAWSKALT